MSRARDSVVAELKQIMAEVGMKASPLAREAGVVSTTLTRFLRDPNAPVLSMTTLTKLRDARDRLLAERKAAPSLDQLTKDAKKRALIAMLLAADGDQMVAIEEGFRSLPKPSPSRRKADDNAA